MKTFKTLLGTAAVLTFLACGGGGGNNNDGGSTPSSQPSFTALPQNQTAKEGASVTFSATATGNPAPTYQWERSSDGTSWSAVSGATSATFTFTVKKEDNDAQIRVKAKNSAGESISNAATLTVQYAPSITTQPKDASVAAGQSVVFSVGAEANPAAAYQWERSGDGSTWSAISGATKDTYVFIAQASDTGAKFRAKVTNVVGEQASATASLSVSAGGGSGTPAKEVTYTDPAGTGWRLLKDASSTSTKLVLNLVGPSGTKARGAGMNLVMDAKGALAWVKFSDGSYIKDGGVFSTGSGDAKLLLGGVKGDKLMVGAFQSKAADPARSVDKPLYGFTFELKSGTNVSAGTPVRIQVGKAQIIPEDISTAAALKRLKDVSVAVGEIVLK